MPRRRLTLITALAVAAQSVTLLPTAGAATPDAQATGAQKAVLSPEPQQTTTRTDGFDLGTTVGLVRGPTTDPDAERVVRDTLTKAGVTTIQTTDGTDPGTPVTVWLGGGSQQLQLQPPTGLPAEGYVLAIGQTKSKKTRKQVVLDGVDTDGTYYAARTLAQLATGHRLPGIAIRDWPTLRYRGSIEGFYGTPWSHQDRLDHLDYLGDHRMNTYEYAPKDDPYHREKWRDAYPPDKLAQLGELVDRASHNKVDFTFALSPGLSICYTSESDYQALIAKFDALYALGARSFNIPLDDIDYNSWHCAADATKYGTGGGAAGQAQSELLNRVQREWVAKKPGVAPLQMVPTEYYNVSESPYKKAIREQLDPAVIVHWTGIGVIPRTITATQAAQAKAVFGHDILIWDNYPVNDYLAGRLPLADYSGREPGIADHVAGVISNPMNQAAVSKIALYSFAEFGWNTPRYDEQASWHRALAERAAGDKKTVEALEVFADLNTYDTTLHPESAPQLSAETTKFWQTWNSGAHTEALKALKPSVRAIETAPARIRAGVQDPAFAAEAKAWLDATELWGQAMERSLRLLEAVAEGDGSAAWKNRQQIDALVAQAKAIRDVREPHSGTYPRIGEGVVDAFLTEAGRVHDQWMGLQPRRTATTSLADVRRQRSGADGRRRRLDLLLEQRRPGHQRRDPGRSRYRPGDRRHRSTDGQIRQSGRLPPLGRTRVLGRRADLDGADPRHDSRSTGDRTGRHSRSLRPLPRPRAQPVVLDGRPRVHSAGARRSHADSHRGTGRLSTVGRSRRRHQYCVRGRRRACCW